MAGSDDDVIARERGRLRRASYLQYAGIAFLLLGACWTYLPALEPWRLAASSFDFYVMAACLAAMCIYAFIFVGFPSAAARSARLIPRQIDGYLAQARWQWLWTLAMMLGVVAGVSRLIATIDEGMRSHRLPADYALTHSGNSLALLALLFVGYALSFATPLTWFSRSRNQVLQDELVRELRATALKIGYVGAVIAIAAGFVVPSITPINPLQLLVWLGYAVVALPVLTYVVLEARAARA